MNWRWCERRHRHPDHDGLEGGGDSAPFHTHETGSLRPSPLSTSEVEVRPGASERAFESDGRLYFDAPSGAGGDMIVAALLDLGVPWSVVSGAVASLGLPGVQLRLYRGLSGAVGGLRFQVEETQPGPSERTYAEIVKLLNAAPLDPSVRQLALTVFERLARAEAKAHQVPVNEVHFHEVGAVDSIVDIVGACAAFAHVGSPAWCSPLPLGRGFVHCRHGVVPLPAPATVECLIGLQCYDAGVDGEFVTPTAAAVLGGLCRGSSGWPSGTIAGVGWGRGTRSWPDRPNLLRAVWVTPVAEK